MKILILEDNLERMKFFRSALLNEELTHASTAEECILALQSETFDVIFLDHDLGGEEMVSSENKNTGAEVCRYISESLKLIENRWLKDPQYIIHSLNADGASNMYQLLLDAGVSDVRMIPFSSLRGRFSKEVP